MSVGLWLATMFLQILKILSGAEMTYLLFNTLPAIHNIHVRVFFIILALDHANLHARQTALSCNTEQPRWTGFGECLGNLPVSLFSRHERAAQGPDWQHQVDQAVLC